MSDRDLLSLLSQSGFGSALFAEPEGGSGPTVHVLDVDPYDYILQAEHDLASSGQLATVNAISNAKRAIDSSIEQALRTFGRARVGGARQAHLDQLASLGLVAPRILRRVVDQRNRVEHEYARPTTTEAEDSVDVATLFVMAIKSAIAMIPSYVVFDGADSDAASFVVEWSSDATLRVLVRAAGDRWVGTATISWGDEVFAPLVRLGYATDRDFRLPEALEALRHVLDSAVG